MNYSINIKDFMLDMLFLAAAERGNLYAQLKVGSMLDMGEGTRMDPERADKWYEKGVLERGEEAQKDLQKAFKWYQKSKLS
jgi:TPR repeat protein